MNVQRIKQRDRHVWERIIESDVVNIENNVRSVANGHEIENENEKLVY